MSALKKNNKNFRSCPIPQNKQSKKSLLECKLGRLPELKGADLVFVRIKKSWLRKLLQKVTNSYWDHVALVLYPVNKEKGNYLNLIIEAVDPSGIEIHKLDKYLKDPEKYEIGIKRVPGLSSETRQRILSFMLMNIDAPYYKFGFFKLLFALISDEYSRKYLGRQRYSCSSFVQKAFYEASTWGQREKFIFREDFLSPIELQGIITPGDIASSDKSNWIYNKH